MTSRSAWSKEVASVNVILHQEGFGGPGRRNRSNKQSHTDTALYFIKGTFPRQGECYRTTARTGNRRRAEHEAKAVQIARTGQERAAICSARWTAKKPGSRIQGSLAGWERQQHEQRFESTGGICRFPRGWFGWLARPKCRAREYRAGEQSTFHSETLRRVSYLAGAGDSPSVGCASCAGRTGRDMERYGRTLENRGAGMGVRGVHTGDSDVRNGDRSFLCRGADHNPFPSITHRRMAR